MSILNYFKTVRVKQNNSKTTLSERYEPLSTEGFLGNSGEVKEIHEWFLSNKPALLIQGPCGCGKTMLVKLLVKFFKIQTFENCSNAKRSKKELCQMYDKIKHNTNSILIIDEIETLVTKNENMSISEISKWISINKIRIIFISDSVVSNKLSYLRDHVLCKTVKLTYPDIESLFSKCIYILEQEDVMSDEIDMVSLKQFIINMNNEPRSIFDSLLIYNITSKTKDKDCDIYQAYEQLIDPSVKLKRKLQTFSIDSGTIPILFQENYLDINLSIDERCKIGESMSDADIFHKKIFMHTSNMYVEIYGTMSSIFYEIIHTKKKKKPRFGLMWTKQSAMCQKRKYIYTVQQSLVLPFTNITEMFHMYKNFKFAVDTYKLNPSDKLHTQISNFISNYDVHDMETLFNLYICFNINEDAPNLEKKTLTKKTFHSLITPFFT